MSRDHSRHDTSFQSRCNSNQYSKKRPPLLTTPSPTHHRSNKSTSEASTHNDNSILFYENQSFDSVSNDASVTNKSRETVTIGAKNSEMINQKGRTIHSNVKSSNNNKNPDPVVSDTISTSTSDKIAVEYVVLPPKLKNSTGKRKASPVNSSETNFAHPHFSYSSHSMLTQPHQHYDNVTNQPNFSQLSHSVQQSSLNVIQPNLPPSNYPGYQQMMAFPDQRSMQPVPMQPYTSHIIDTGPLNAPINNQNFVNPYSYLVTPQFPILNAPSLDQSYHTVNSQDTVRTDNQSMPPYDADRVVIDDQASSGKTFSSNQTPLNSESETISVTGKKDADNINVKNKRIRKERPSKPKTHIKIDHLFSLIESIQDVEQLKAASSIVREIIRILPLKRNASISWVDKETILHAIDELGRHFEDHIKLQIRRSVLRYGFQVIHPNFVPDVTNTKCDIGDHEFANKYKISKGFVQESSRDSDSGSDLEQARRLVDNKYYSCWINREYSKNICMQRLSIKAKGEKGEPISFKGFKWGHPLLEADLETSFIVRPEHRVPFYQWLGKSIPSKPPKRKQEAKPGGSDHVIMKVNLTKPMSGLKGLPQNLCECEFWEFNGINRNCSRSYQYPKGMRKITTFLAENHPLQPVTFDKTKLQQVIFDCD